MAAAGVSALADSPAANSTAAAAIHPPLSPRMPSCPDTRRTQRSSPSPSVRFKAPVWAPLSLSSSSCLSWLPSLSGLSCLSAQRTWRTLPPVCVGDSPPRGPSPPSQPGTPMRTSFFGVHVGGSMSTCHVRYPCSAAEALRSDSMTALHARRCASRAARAPADILGARLRRRWRFSHFAATSAADCCRGVGGVGGDGGDGGGSVDHSATAAVEDSSSSSPMAGSVRAVGVASSSFQPTSPLPSTLPSPSPCPRPSSALPPTYTYSTACDHIEDDDDQGDFPTSAPTPALVPIPNFLSASIPVLTINPATSLPHSATPAPDSATSSPDSATSALDAPARRGGARAPHASYPSCPKSAACAMAT
mmetsp:Transcript_3095/g.7609  ORF Transcript_3095/g.7609 Transcript_3095/m.7609 type:complete len:362 (-) Transcript_3095:1325-2410(-)